MLLNGCTDLRRKGICQCIVLDVSFLHHSMTVTTYWEYELLPGTICCIIAALIEYVLTLPGNITMNAFYPKSFPRGCAQLDHNLLMQTLQSILVLEMTPAEQNVQHCTNGNRCCHIVMLVVYQDLFVAGPSQMLAKSSLTLYKFDLLVSSNAHIIPPQSVFARSLDVQ